MGKVLQLKQKRRLQQPVEGSAEEEKLVKELYKRIEMVARGSHEIVVCKAIAVYMGTRMLVTKNPAAVIGGFMRHIEECANRAIAQHTKENSNAPQVYGEANKTPQGDHRNLEVEEGQEVLCPPAVEQREGDVPEHAGTQPPSGPDEDRAVDDRPV